MPAPASPSDALAQVAEALHGLETRDDVAGEVTAWVERVGDELGDRADGRPPEHRLAPHELYELPEIAAIRVWPPTVPDNFDEFVRLVAAMQVLDRWHLPLVPSGAGAILERGDAHQDAADALVIDGCFGVALNGQIIPGAAWGRMTDDLVDCHEQILELQHPGSPLGSVGAHVRPIVLRALLEYTAYLPKELEVEDANEAGQLSGRKVTLTYRRPEVGRGSLRPSRPLGEAITVGIAPLLEGPGDAKFQLSPSRDRYGVVPTYPTSRLVEVVKAALEQGVELLMMPEMSVAEEDLEALSEVVLEASREFSARHGGEPALLYVAAGATAPPGRSDDPHRNFVVILDRFGEELARQEKMFRWNLKDEHLDMFELNSDFGPLKSPLFENIEPARHVEVIDLEDLGRIITLICADMDFNTPGDWLLTHLRVDWLYAPIMDKFVPLKPIADAPWIVKRAHRAACVGQSKIVVTNSVTLTHRLNRSNLRTRAPWPQQTTCGVGLLVDGTTAAPTCAHIEVDLASPSHLLVRRWRDGWVEFPP